MELKSKSLSPQVASRRMSLPNIKVTESPNKTDLFKIELSSVRQKYRAIAGGKHLELLEVL